MALYSVTLSLIYLLFYIPPFESATGRSATSELILISIGPVLWIGTALVARRTILQDYGAG